MTYPVSTIDGIDIIFSFDAKYNWNINPSILVPYKYIRICVTASLGTVSPDTIYCPFFPNCNPSTIIDFSFQNTFHFVRILEYHLEQIPSAGFINMMNDPIIDLNLNDLLTIRSFASSTLIYLVPKIFTSLTSFILHTKYMIRIVYSG